MKEVLPLAEHRQCARHIAQNFNKKFPGAHFENLYWKACNSTTEQGFKVIMQELEKLSPPAVKYLLDKDPKTWSKAYYQTGRCDESVENGGSESFNAVLVDARKKPIISMLEELRMYMMEKLFKSPQRLWSSEVSPAIRLKLEILKRDQRFWQVLPSGMEKFETRNGREAFEVDLEKRTCSCRVWQLNGYGCVHSVAAISHLNRDPDSYVNSFFKRDMYMKTYQFNINPLNGATMWPETTYTPPLPPKFRKMPGRPKTKRIRSGSENVGKHKLSKAGKQVICGNCCQVGHNRRGCPSDGTRGKLPVKRNKRARVEHVQVFIDISFSG